MTIPIRHPMPPLARAVLACVVVLSMGGHATAQVADRGHGAAKHFEDGVALYRAGRFQEAIEHFQKAYELKPEPVLLYNVARAYEGLGELKRALEGYRAYLSA